MTSPAPAQLLAALRRAGLLRHAPPPEALAGVRGLAADSRAVQPGDLFIAVRGTQADGHHFVRDAIARGAAAVAVESALEAPVPRILVGDGRLAAITLARAWHGDPAAAMLLVGVTGTNGKTTTSGLIRHLLNRGGDAGVIGTLGAFDGAGAAVPSEAGDLTTPGPLGLHATFAALRSRGVTRVAMEASSHSLDQGRLDGLVFSAAVFTNLTLEHLDYHETMERYRSAKLRLLGLLARDAVVAVNADDPAWRVMPPGPGRIRFGFGPDAELRAALPALGATGSRFRVEGRFGIAEATLPLPGEFNIANALAALAVGLGLGQPLGELVERLAGSPQVAGRMERIGGTAFTVLRDYAHTPDALERALAAVRRITPGRLLLVFGCGGDRDRAKRPVMGRLAATAADFTYLTSDNPRTEDPAAILAEIAAGVPPGAPHRLIPDRRAAIGAALAAARSGDTVLLAGKGHETYQIVGSVKHPFDERRIVAELLAAGPDGIPDAVD